MNIMLDIYFILNFVILNVIGRKMRSNLCCIATSTVSQGFRPSLIQHKLPACRVDSNIYVQNLRHQFPSCICCIWSAYMDITYCQRTYEMLKWYLLSFDVKEIMHFLCMGACSCLRIYETFKNFPLLHHISWVVFTWMK